MKVSVIIVNYNTRKLTTDCLQSVIRQTRVCAYEIILVDNASTECDPDVFINEFPSIKLIKSTKNGGFAYGNNLGINEATGEYILLLNSDTFLTEESICRCVEIMDKHPEVGVLGCRMIYPDGKIQYTARRFRSIGWELLDFFRFIPNSMSYSKRSRLMLGKYFHHDEPVFCDWLNGAFFLFPRKILVELPENKLDDRFFMYGEDQLWCEQIKNLGYRILFYPDTTIIHINSGSTDLSKQLRLRKTMLTNELEIVSRRKGKGFYFFFFKIIYITKEGVRNFIKSIFFRLTGKLIK
jgi:hypothetical protein